METLSRVEAAATLRQNVRPRREPNFVGKRACSKEPQCAACVQWRRLCVCSDRGKMNNKDKCVQIIKLYEKHRELWDPTSPNHYDTNFKEDSWKLISEEMKLPVIELKKKMTSLCGSYRREKSRHKQSLITGSGRKDVYVSKWFAYDHFYFLAEKNSPRETQDSMIQNSTDTLAGNTREPLSSNVESFESASASQQQSHPPTSQQQSQPSTSQQQSQTSTSQQQSQPSTSQQQSQPSTSQQQSQTSTSQQQSQPSTSQQQSQTSTSQQQSQTSTSQQQSRPSISRSSNKRKTTNDYADTIDLDKAMEVLNYTDDSYDTFGKHIASELRKYDPITLAYAKKGITDVLFQADIGMLSRTQQQQGYFTQQQNSANTENTEDLTSL